MWSVTVLFCAFWPLLCCPAVAGSSGDKQGDQLPSFCPAAGKILIFGSELCIGLLRVQFARARSPVQLGSQD